MDKNIKNVLIASGWFENRKVDISKCIHSFNKDSIELTYSSVLFMEEYYNLKIKIIPKFEKLKGESIVIDINSHSSIDPEFLDKYNKYYNKKLIPVADCYDYAMIILIDEDGAFYGASDQFIAVIGNNFEELLKNMINGVINTKEFVWHEIEDF